jgi:SAM-dependent methyltransferase
LGAQTALSDLSLEACLRAREFFDLDAVALNSARLPFVDDAFDVVICSEMIEHVEYPVETLLELRRVARCALILTTDEVWHDEEERDQELFERTGLPHLETCMFTPEEFDVVLGRPDARWLHYRAPYIDEPCSEQAARDWILGSIEPPEISDEGEGIALLHIYDDHARRDALPGEEAAILDRLFATAVPEAAVGSAPFVDRVELRDFLLTRLREPSSAAPLSFDGDCLVDEHGRRHAVHRGVPDFEACYPDVLREEDFEERVAREFPDDPERQRALLEMRRRLTLPETAGQHDWQFSDIEGRRGWKANEELEPEDVEGAWGLVSTGTDPWLMGPRCELPVERVGQIRLRMSVHNPDFPREGGEGQLFWMHEDAYAFEESSSLLFPIYNDGELHEYVLDPRSAEGWPRAGSILNFRIDPANGPARVRLHSLSVELRVNP